MSIITPGLNKSTHVQAHPENVSRDIKGSLAASTALMVVLGVIAMIGCGAAGLHGHLSLSAGGAGALVSVGTALAMSLVGTVVAAKFFSDIFRR